MAGRDDPFPDHTWPRRTTCSVVACAFGRTSSYLRTLESVPPAATPLTSWLAPSSCWWCPVLDKIVTRTIQCPDDVELLGTLTKDRCDTRVILPFVLEEYEDDYVRKNGFDSAGLSAVTIEHVLPRNLSVAWRAAFTAHKHERLYGLLGNLVPLSEKQNKSIQDDSWKKKAARYRGSNFKSTQALAKRNAWTESVITQRTMRLAQWASRRWPQLD